jgi:hypothetical protein
MSDPQGAKRATRVSLHARRVSPAPRLRKYRRLRCDCGQLAVKVITVRVGSDPQYIVHMPLCRKCLALELSIHEPGEL